MDSASVQPVRHERRRRVTEGLVHGAVVCIGLIVYGVLTALGKDGNPALAAALAWGSGAAAQAGLSKQRTP